MFLETCEQPSQLYPCPAGRSGPAPDERGRLWEAMSATARRGESAAHTRREAGPASPAGGTVTAAARPGADPSCARVKVHICALSGTGGGWPAEPPPCLSGDTAVAHMLQHSDAWGHEGEVFPSSSKVGAKKERSPCSTGAWETHAWRSVAVLGDSGGRGQRG